MKINIILIGLLLNLFSANSQPADSGSFILKGRVIGKDTGYVYLYYRGLNGSGSDSFHLNRGEFIFKGKVSEPTPAVFSTFCFATENREKYDSKNISDELFIEPGLMSLLATYNSFEDARLVGSASDSDRVKLLRMKDTVEMKIRPVMQVYDVLAPLYNAEFIRNPKSETVKRLKIRLDSITAVLDPFYAEESKIDYAFIVNNPTSYFAAFMLMRRVAGGPTDQFPDIKKLYDRFSPEIKESDYGKDIKLVMDFGRNIYVVAEAIDFMALNSQGDTVRLSDFRNKKYVLLDFWGSWCHPCRQTTPLLVKINEKYKEKVNLISIANHDKEENWLAAIKKDQMNWTQILDNNSSRIISPGGGSITDAYYINGIPSLILIDKDHKILRLFGCGGRNGLYVEDIDKELEKILQ